MNEWESEWIDEVNGEWAGECKILAGKTIRGICPAHRSSSSPYWISTYFAWTVTPRTVKELRPHCERASVNDEIFKITPIFFSSLSSFLSKERVSIVLNCFYICNFYRNSISSVSTFSSSLTVRVFPVFQTKNPDSILNCALIDQISSNQVACQRSADWG